MVEIALTVNGRQEMVSVESDTTLLEVLRNDLGLTAAKLGCGLEQCYACAVLVDGAATTSCASAAVEFTGREITTAEGLSAESLHPVQQAFIAEEAGQCGYCIPGMVIGAVALLQRNPDPTDVEIRRALEPHLCRCGSHWRIIKAVKRAAQAMA